MFTPVPCYSHACHYNVDLCRHTHTRVYTTPYQRTHSILSMCPLPSALWQPWASSMFTKMSSHFILPACACKLPISGLLKALLCFYGAVRALLGHSTDPQQKSGPSVIQGLHTLHIHSIYIYTLYPHSSYKMQYTCRTVLEWLHGSIRVKMREDMTASGESQDYWFHCAGSIYWNRMTAWLLS